MTFEEWCHSIGMEETRINKTDLVSMETLKECWDHKEMEIQKLKETLDKLEIVEDENE